VCLTIAGSAAAQMGVSRPAILTEPRAPASPVEPGALATPTAQAAPPKTAAPAAAAVRKLGPVTVQGNFRTRLEAWDWFVPDQGDNNYLYSGNLLRLSFSQAREQVDWQVELAVPFLLGLPNNAVGPGAQGQLGLGANYFLANDRSRNAAMLFPQAGFHAVQENARRPQSQRPRRPLRE
jgi:hypothetical protein